MGNNGDCGARNGAGQRCPSPPTQTPKEFPCPGNCDRSERLLRRGPHRPGGTSRPLTKWHVNWSETLLEVPDRQCWARTTTAVLFDIERGRRIATLRSSLRYLWSQLGLATNVFPSHLPIECPIHVESKSLGCSPTSTAIIRAMTFGKRGRRGLPRSTQTRVGRRSLRRDCCAFCCCRFSTRYAASDC